MLALTACIAMTGCGGSETQAVALGGACSFSAQITKGEESFELAFERDENGAWEASFTSPESLSDMTLVSFGESCEIRYQGLSLELAAEDMPHGAVTAVIESCIDHAANSSSAQWTADGDLKLVKGEVSCGAYELRVAQSGELVSLHVGTELCAEFSEYERQG